MLIKEYIDTSLIREIQTRNNIKTTYKFDFGYSDGKVQALELLAKTFETEGRQDFEEFVFTAAQKCAETCTRSDLNAYQHGFATGGREVFCSVASMIKEHQFEEPTLTGGFEELSIKPDLYDLDPEVFGYAR